VILRKANNELLDLAKQYKAIAVIGSRQSGKTTLVKSN
jgi:predicted AAA+ superfamily ATPase